MATTELPPAHASELHDVPVLIVQLQDDLARSRLREAFWMSLVVHLLILIAIGTSPRWIAYPKPIAVRTADEIIRDKQLTYLDLPHDNQRVEQRPNTDKISDKNRIATSRHPVPDRKTLDELREARRPGPPMPPSPPPAPAQAAQSADTPLQGTPGGSPQPQVAPQPQVQAKANVPNPFGRAASPGSAIEQAARAAASSRAGGGYGGAGGDYGLGAPSAGHAQGNLEILSDTMGVDFGPYLSRVLHDVRSNWYNLIPEVARAPIMKRGKVAIEFAITRDGKVAGLRMSGSSGDIALDRAAWGGISASNPFPPLPSDFRGQYLALRFYFFYNPDKNELR